MTKKKAAFMIYPNFSLEEISPILQMFKLWYGYEIHLFSKDKNSVFSEEGIEVIPSKTFDKFNIENYDCLILTGILEPFPVLFDDEIINFLKQFKNCKKTFVIASISSSPLLLARAGLLDNKKFIAGIYEEVYDMLDFINKENIIKKPVVVDENYITAYGGANREFAIEILRAIGIKDTDLPSIEKKYKFNEDELVFTLSKYGKEEVENYFNEINKYIKS